MLDEVVAHAVSAVIILVVPHTMIPTQLHA